MADSFTPVANLVKPEVGASRDTWGTKTNSNWDKVDAALALRSVDALSVLKDSATGFAAVPAGNNAQRPTGPVGGFRFNNEINRFETIPNEGGYRALAWDIPYGAVIMWAGAIADIPKGWHLCDGTAGTPDLRDRFIVGAGSGYGPGAAGGANTVTLNGSTDGHVLSENEMAYHTHPQSPHGHNGWQDGHAHTVGGSAITGSGGSVGVAAPAWALGGVITDTRTPAVGIDAQLANISYEGGNWGHTHGISFGVIENRPPYVALAYIMKISA